MDPDTLAQLMLAVAEQTADDPEAQEKALNLVVKLAHHRSDKEVSDLAESFAVASSTFAGTAHQRPR